MPTRIQLLPPSGFAGRDGRGPFTYSLNNLLDAFNSYGMPLPMDYEHQSLAATDKTEPTPASGWINAIDFDEAGVRGTVEWTERAATFVAARECRFISPVFQRGAQTRLDAAGYTDLPTTIETAGAVPAAFVVYEGSSQGKGDVLGAALNLQYWTARRRSGSARR